MNICFDMAKQIKELDKADPEWDAKVACMLKKAIHDEKFNIYHRLFLYMRHLPRKPKAFKKSVKRMIDDYVKVKVATHDGFRNLPYRKQIYGLFDWKK